jgi:glycerol-3-phosphate acyltransferase PlsY
VIASIMSDETPQDPGRESGPETGSSTTPPPASKPLPLPGMAGIALYMLALSAVIAFGVLGHHYPPLVLIVSGLTACASFGLLRQQRWGWALSLAATFLLMLYQFYVAFRLHQVPAGFMGVLNLVLFLYLIRPEVMERLK